MPGIRQVQVFKEPEDGALSDLSFNGFLAFSGAFRGSGGPGHFPHRLVFHDVGNAYHHLLVPQQAHHPDRLDAVSAQLEETVQRADRLFKPQDGLHRPGDGLLRRALRLDVLPGGGQFGFRQGLLVHLAVRGQRQRFQPDQHAGNHILGQVGLKPAPQARLVNLSVCRVIQAERLFDHPGRRLGDAFILHRGVLDLAQFDPEAAKLHLVVNPPEVFQFAVLVVAGQVSRTVNPRLRARQQADLRNRREFLPGQVFPFPVADGCLGARQAQLSRQSAGQQPARFITDQAPAVRHRPADGNIPVLLLVHFVITAADRKLRRSVAVDHTGSGLPERQHLFAAHHQEPERQVRELVDHRHADLRAHRQPRNAVLPEVAVHAGQVLSQLVREDVYAAAEGKRAEQVVQRRVKGETGMQRVAAVRVDVQQLPPPGQEGCQGPVALHHALRFARASGGVDHVGGPVRLRHIHGIDIPVGGSDQFLQFVNRQRNPGFAVFQHIGDPVFRILGIHRDIGRSGLHHADDGGGEFLHPRHPDCDKISRPDAGVPQRAGQQVGHPVQFAVGIAADAVHGRGMVRLHAGLFGKQVDKGLCCIVDQFPAAAEFRDLHRAFNIRPRQNAQRHIRELGHNSGKVPEQLQQTADLRRIVFRRIVADMQAQLSLAVDHRHRVDRVKDFLLHAEGRHRQGVGQQVGLPAAAVVLKGHHRLQQAVLKPGRRHRLREHAPVVGAAFRGLLLKVPDGLPGGGLLLRLQPQRNRVDEQAHHLADVRIRVVPAADHLSVDHVPAPAVSLQHQAPDQFDAVADRSALLGADLFQFFRRGGGNGDLHFIPLPRFRGNFAVAGNLRLCFVTAQQVPPVGERFLLILPLQFPDRALVGARIVLRRFRRGYSAPFLLQHGLQVVHVQLHAPAVLDNMMAHRHQIAAVLAVPDEDQPEQGLVLQVKPFFQQFLPQVQHHPVRVLAPGVIQHLNPRNPVGDHLAVPADALMDNGAPQHLVPDQQAAEGPVQAFLRRQPSAPVDEYQPVGRAFRIGQVLKQHRFLHSAQGKDPLDRCTLFAEGRSDLLKFLPAPFRFAQVAGRGLFVRRLQAVRGFLQFFRDLPAERLRLVPAVYGPVIVHRHGQDAAADKRVDQQGAALVVAFVPDRAGGDAVFLPEEAAGLVFRVHFAQVVEADPGRHALRRVRGRSQQRIADALVRDPAQRFLHVQQVVLRPAADAFKHNRIHGREPADRPVCQQSRADVLAPVPFHLDADAVLSAHCQIASADRGQPQVVDLQVPGAQPRRKDVLRFLRAGGQSDMVILTPSALQRPVPEAAGLFLRPLPEGGFQAQGIAVPGSLHAFDVVRIGMGLLRQPDLFAAFSRLPVRAFKVFLQDSPAHAVCDQVMRAEEYVIRFFSFHQAYAEQRFLHPDPLLDPGAGLLRGQAEILRSPKVDCFHGDPRVRLPDGHLSVPADGPQHVVLPGQRVNRALQGLRVRLPGAAVKHCLVEMRRHGIIAGKEMIVNRGAPDRPADALLLRPHGLLLPAGFRDPTHRLQAHDLADGNRQPGLAQNAHHPDRLDAVPAPFKEAVQRADLFLQAQRCLHRGNDRLFGLSLGRGVFLSAADLGNRQLLPVDLSVRQPRHFLQFHIQIRIHVFRQGGMLNGVPQRFLLRGYALLLRIVQHQMRRIADLLYGGRRHGNPGRGRRQALDLAHLDPVAPQFHLLVDPPQAFNLSFLIPPGQVACVVHPDPVHKRAVSEHFFGFLVQFPVSAAHLRSGVAKLAGGAPGQQAAVPADNKAPAVRHRPADRHAGIEPSFFQLVYAGIVGTFGRSVFVDDLDPVAARMGQRLAAGRHVPHRQVVSLDHHFGNGGGKAAPGDLPLMHERRHRVQVLPDLFGHDMDACAAGKHRENVFDMRVKTEAAVARHPVFRRQLVLGGRGHRKIHQSPVGQHDALRLARAAGGIDHVGQVVGFYLRGRFAGAGFGFFPVHGHAVPAEGKAVQQQLCLAVRQHIVDPFLRIGRVNRHISAPGLVNAQDRGDEFLAPRQADSHKRLRGNAPCSQPAGQPVGRLVQLPVGHAGNAVRNGGPFRAFLHLSAEKGEPGLSPVVFKVGTPAQLHQCRRFLIIRQRDVVQQRLRRVHHSPHDGPDRFSGHLQNRMVIQTLAAFQPDLVFVFMPVDMHRKVRVRRSADHDAAGNRVPADLKGFLKAGHAHEVERNHRFFFQIRAEVGKGIGAQPHRLPLPEFADVIDHPALSVHRVHHRHALDKHADGVPAFLFPARVAGEIGQLLLPAKGAHHIDESGPEQVVNLHSVLPAPLVDGFPADAQDFPDHGLRFLRGIAAERGAFHVGVQFLIVCLRLLIRLVSHFRRFFFRGLVQVHGRGFRLPPLVQGRQFGMVDHGDHARAVADHMAHVHQLVFAFFRLNEFHPDQRLSAEQVKRPHKAAADVGLQLIVPVEPQDHGDLHTFITVLVDLALFVKSKPGPEHPVPADQFFPCSLQPLHADIVRQPADIRQVVSRGIGMLDAFGKHAHL